MISAYLTDKMIDKLEDGCSKDSKCWGIEPRIGPSSRQIKLTKEIQRNSPQMRFNEDSLPYVVSRMSKSTYDPRG